MTATSHTLEADDYVSFGSLSPHLPGTLRERKIARYEASLLAFLGDETQLPGRLSVYREAHEQLQSHLAGSLKATDALVAGPRVLTADFWTRLDADGLSLLQRLSASRSGALLAEAQLQVHEGRLSAQSYELLKEVVSEPWSVLRGESTVRVCDVSLGNTQHSYLLLGAMVMTRQPALDDHQADELVYLFVPGLAGGLHAFGSVARLKVALARSVRADPDGFWLGHVSLKSRAGARAAISAEAEGGRYRRGSIGFGMVFRGPNGDVYLMEIRHLQPTGSSWGKITFERSSSGSSIMMSDDWVEIVAQRSITEVPFNPAAVAVLQVKADGRLFKLIGTITPDRGVMVFMIAGPAGVPSPVVQAL